jgi:hypothetical protein
MEQLFSNVETLLPVNTALLQNLEQKIQVLKTKGDGGGIAEIFTVLVSVSRNEKFIENSREEV